MPQETKFLARNRKHSVKEWVKRVESDIFSKLSEVCTIKKRPLYRVHEIMGSVHVCEPHTHTIRGPITC